MNMLLIEEIWAGLWHSFETQEYRISLFKSEVYIHLGMIE